VIGFGAAMVIDAASEAMKFLSEMIWEELKWHKATDTWDLGKIGWGLFFVTVCIGIIGFVTWWLEEEVEFRGRLWLVIVAALILGALRPGRLLEHSLLVAQLHKVQKGQDLYSVRHGIDDAPWLDTIGKGNQLTYELPSIRHIQIVTITFDSEGKVVNVSEIPETVW
jgi:hypothetical protein